MTYPSARWKHLVQNLYYIGLDNKPITMRLVLGTPVKGEAPTELFPAPSYDWEPSPDGKRFLFLVSQQQQPTPLTVVLNWQAGLKK